MENEIKVGDIVVNEGSDMKYQIWGERTTSGFASSP